MKSLKNVMWKDFPIQEIFYEIQRGKRLKNEDHIPGNMPYVSSSAINNGIDDFVSNEEKVRMFKDCITIANSGSVGASFYHPYTFVASDHVTQLKRSNCNKYIYLFLATISYRLSEKYSFNREINESRVKRERLLLPATPDGSPDFKFMEQYMRGIEKKLLKRYACYLENKGFSQWEIASLNEETTASANKWKPFRIEEVCEIASGRDIYDKERFDGNNPYITASALNNGIGYFVGNKNDTLESGCISVNRNGSVGYSFYHPYSALYGNDTRKLRPFNKNRYVCFFLTRMITAQKDKYGYGLKLGTERLKKQQIMLPDTLDGYPDYNFMEQYMREKEQKLIHRYIEYRLKNV